MHRHLLISFLLVSGLFINSKQAKAQDLSGFELLAHYSLINTAVDSTSNHNNVNLMNAAFNDEKGVYSNGIYIGNDSEGSLIETPQLPEIDFSQLLISVEFKMEDLSIDRPVIIAGSSWRWFGAFVKAADSTLHMVYNNRNRNLSTSKITPGQWHTLALMYQDSTGSLFLDGEKIDSVDFNINAPDNDKAISNINGGSGEAFKGYLRQLKVYKPANLSSIHQYERIADSGYSIFPNPSGSIFNIHQDSEKEGKTTLEIFDINGKSIIQTESAEKDMQVDLSKYKTGVYILHINKKSRHRLIKN